MNLTIKQLEQKQKAFHHQSQEEAVKSCNGSFANAPKGKQFCSRDTESSSSGAGSIDDSLEHESGNVVDVADYSIESKTIPNETLPQPQDIERLETTTSIAQAEQSDQQQANQIGDSLQNVLQTDMVDSVQKVNGGSRLNEDDVQTIKNYQNASASEETAINSMKNNETKTTTPTTPQETVSEVNQEKLESMQYNDANKSKLPVATDVPEDKLHSTRSPLTISNNNNNISPENSPPTDLHEEKTQKTQSTLMATQTNNNNYSGLNLNMTASEMRELLARRKKFDPKKAQMNIRQKYEIIQQM